MNSKIFRSNFVNYCLQFQDHSIPPYSEIQDHQSLNMILPHLCSFVGGNGQKPHKIYAQIFYSSSSSILLKEEDLLSFKCQMEHWGCSMPSLLFLPFTFMASGSCLAFKQNQNQLLVDTGPKTIPIPYMAQMTPYGLLCSSLCTQQPK